MKSIICARGRISAAGRIRFFSFRTKKTPRVVQTSYENVVPHGGSRPKCYYHCYEDAASPTWNVRRTDKAGTTRAPLETSRSMWT